LVENIFWIIFIIFPFVTGLFAYQWLPNESPYGANIKILSTYEKCHPMSDECQEVANVWMNTETGQVYTPEDFKKHGNIETLKNLFRFVVYMSLGGLAYMGFNHFKNRFSK